MSAVVPRIDVDLEDVECIVKITRPLVGVPDSVIWTELPSGVAKVSTDATLYIFDEDDDGKPERRVIARASAYTIDLARVGDVVDAFDQVGGEASEIAELILGSDNIFDMLDASDPLVGEQVSQLVIVEHVSVLEPYRGQRLGPRLLTTLVETVTGTGDGNAHRAPRATGAVGAPLRDRVCDARERRSLRRTRVLDSRTSTTTSIGGTMRS